VTWPTVAIGEVAKISAGNGAPQDPRAFSKYGTPFIRAGSLAGLLQGSVDHLERIAEQDASRLRLRRFPKDAILFAKSGMSCMKGYVFRLPFEAHVVNHLAVARPGAKLYPSYAEHALRVFSPVTLVKDESYPSIRLSDIEALEIPLPPLTEQKRIAAILDQAGALRRLRRRVLDRLNTLGQAIFQEMFGGASHSTLPLGSLVDIRSSLTDPAELPDALHVGPEHIASGSGRVSWHEVRTCEQDGVTSGKYAFKEDDVLYSKIRPYLNKVAVADRSGLCSADMYALRAREGILATDYLHFVLGDRRFLTYAESVSNRANIPKMNRKQLLAYEVSVPGMDSQKRFSDRLARLKMIETQGNIASIEADHLFASLQHRAFTGQL